MTHTATIVKQQHQPRSARQHHRHTKSDAVNVPQNVAPVPRHNPHHNSAHHQHNPPPRGLNSHVSHPNVTPPQSPARPVQNMSTKKKKRPRKAAAKESGVELSPPQQSVLPVQETVPQVTTPPMSKRVVSDPSAFTPSSPSDSPGRPVYAGPTFHQSPAPKNLPVPRFFSKSVPAPPASGFQSMVDTDDNSTDESDSSTTGENGLERLFKADREEKARRRQQVDDSSDNDSVTPESTNPNAFFGMEPDSPFRLPTPRGLPRPQMGRMASEPQFSMDVEKEASRAAGLRADPTKDNATEAALRAFIYQSPVAIQPGHSPIPHHMNVDVSPSPASRTASPSHYVHGSPTPQRRLNFQRSPPTGPSALSPQTPPPRPRYGMAQNRTGPRPVHVQPEPVTPTRPTNRLFFNSHPRHPAPAPPAPCSQDVHDMEATLRMMLKLDTNDRAGSVQLSPLPVRT